MTNREFFKKLALTILITGGILLGLDQLDGMAAFLYFTWPTFILFVLLTFFLYKAAFTAAHSENKNKFTSVIIGAVMGKLALSMAIIMGFFYGFKPDSRLFLIPFFVIYVGFTIFELHFMMRLGRVKPE